jgi:protein gp37
VLDEKQLLSVLKMKKPCKIFWGDMTDLFQDSIPFKMLDKCFAVCALTPHITHMFLTKRPERMLEYFTRGATKGEVIQGAFEIHRDILKGVKDARLWTEPEWPLPSVWYGTSCENQKYAEQRIPILCKIPNATLFISAEPLLSGIELERMRLVRPNGNGYEFNALTGEQYFAGCGSVSSQTFQVNKISLVIIGGESGKNARFMDPEWMRSLRDQCKRWGAACFCKQMGSVYGENKGKNLPDDLNIREFPKG